MYVTNIVIITFSNKLAYRDEMFDVPKWVIVTFMVVSYVSFLIIIALDIVLLRMSLQIIELLKQEHSLHIKKALALVYITFTFLCIGPTYFFIVYPTTNFLVYNKKLTLDMCDDMQSLHIYYAAMSTFTNVEPLIYSLCLAVIIGFLAHSQELAKKRAENGSDPSSYVGSMVESAKRADYINKHNVFDDPRTQRVNSDQLLSVNEDSDDD